MKFIELIWRQSIEYYKARKKTQIETIERRGGNSVGIGTVWLQRGKYHYYPQEPIDKPSITIKNFTQLPEEIEKFEKKEKSVIEVNKKIYN